jgi:endoglucanase
MAAGNSIIVANAQLELGSSATTYEPNPWLGHAQAAVTAIRAIDADMPIYVAGFDFGNGDRWYRENYEMCLVTGGNIIFEAHQYFDGPQGVGGGGSYSGSYASYNITPNSGVEAFDKFNAWCTEVGVKGFYGEFGVPSSDADWRALQKNFLRALRHNRMRGTCWFYGANGIKPAEILNLTIGGNRLYDVVSS